MTDTDDCDWNPDKVKLEPELILDQPIIMDTDDCDWNPDKVKLESELIMDDHIGTADGFTVENGPMIPESTELILGGGSSLSSELASSLQQDVVVKEEITEDGTLFTDEYTDKDCGTLPRNCSSANHNAATIVSEEGTTIMLNYNLIKEEPSQLESMETNEDFFTDDCQNNTSKTVREVNHSGDTRFSEDNKFEKTKQSEKKQTTRSYRVNETLSQFEFVAVEEARIKGTSSSASGFSAESDCQTKLSLSPASGVIHHLKVEAEDYKTKSGSSSGSEHHATTSKFVVEPGKEMRPRRSSGNFTNSCATRVCKPEKPSGDFILYFVAKIKNSDTKISNHKAFCLGPYVPKSVIDAAASSSAAVCSSKATEIGTEIAKKTSNETAVSVDLLSKQSPQLSKLQSNTESTSLHQLPSISSVGNAYPVKHAQNIIALNEKFTKNSSESPKPSSDFMPKEKPKFSSKQRFVKIDRVNDLKIHMEGRSNAVATSSGLGLVGIQSTYVNERPLLPQSAKKPFACNRCPARFKRNFEMKQHLVIHSDERPFSCDQCSYVCKRKKDLKNHMLSHSDERPFSCNLCSYACKQKKDLKLHMLSHSNERPFSCDQCSYTSKQKGHLQMHLLSHSDKRPFSCDQCSYSCKQKAHLQMHMLSHSGERPFSCDQCSYACKLKGMLQRHLLSHSDERPFSCDQCSYAFKQKSDLRKHLLSHSDKRPFSCNQCSYTSKQKGHLQRHLRSHSDERPFRCDQCSYSCKGKGVLQLHMLSHSDERPFSCNQCSYACKRKENLKKHFLSHSN